MPWDAERDDLLRAGWRQGRILKTLAADLGVSVSALTRRRKRLGLSARHRFRDPGIGSVRVCVNLPKESHARLCRLAHARGCTMAAFVKGILTEWLDRSSAMRDNEQINCEHR